MQPTRRRQTPRPLGVDALGIGRVFEDSARLHLVSLSFPWYLAITQPKALTLQNIRALFRRFVLIPKNILGTLFSLVAPILEEASGKVFGTAHFFTLLSQLSYRSNW